ncbi:MAG: GGDEF domain-containing protein [Labilithrix sp.]|nr:GGDEF domain-containing protein [Labilithrix sp.]
MTGKADQRELENLKILQGVALPEIRDKLDACPVRLLDAGEQLLAMGQPNRVMYMILSGRLSVHLEGGPKSEPVAFLGAGETVGEISILDASPASAHVVAAEPSRVLAVGDEVFWTLVDASHDFAVNLLVMLAKRLRRNNATVDDNIRLQREYKRNALVDALTGLYNRRWLDDTLPRMIKRCARSQQPLAVLMIDIDHFKRFNDEHGHASGDAVLAAVAHALRATLRPTDMVARYGGEELAVILPETGPRAARGVAERLRVAVRETVVKDPTGRVLPRVTISLGGAIIDEDDPSAKGVLAAADANLYLSKQNGRDRATL